MIKKNKLFLFIIILFSSIFSASSFTGWGSAILHHVADSNPVYLFDNDGEKSFPITKHIIMLLISAIVTLVLSILATQKYRKNVNAKPSGLSQIFEILMDFINKEIVIPNIGKNYIKTWTPVAMTFFTFILTCNLLGLIPFFEFIKISGGGGSTATGNFGVTLGLATITFFAIIIAGVKKYGFIGHWKNMVPSGVPAPVLIILIPIEIIGMFVKPFALIMRLGANMTAGHIGMLAIFGLPYLIGTQAIPSEGLLPQPSWGFALIAIMLNVGVFFLEIIVSLVQAYVFTLLSSVFIGMAIHAEH